MTSASQQGEDCDTEAVAWSTNPIPRKALANGALKPEMEDEMGGYWVSYGWVGETELSDLNEAAALREERKTAVDLVLCILLGVQLPAVVAIFAAAPTVDWRVVDACATAL